MVDVSVSTPVGTSAIGYPDDQFAFIPKPSVRSLSPSTGTTAGGTTVTVKGSHFSGATAVQLGAASISGFTVVSDTVITFLTPTHVAGQEDVIVTTPEGTSRTTTSDLFTYSTSAVMVTTTALPAGNQVAPISAVRPSGRGRDHPIPLGNRPRLVAALRDETELQGRPERRPAVRGKLQLHSRGH